MVPPGACCDDAAIALSLCMVQSLHTSGRSRGDWLSSLHSRICAWSPSRSAWSTLGLHLPGGSSLVIEWGSHRMMSFLVLVVMLQKIHIWADAECYWEPLCGMHPNAVILVCMCSSCHCYCILIDLLAWWCVLLSVINGCTRVTSSWWVYIALTCVFLLHSLLYWMFPHWWFTYAFMLGYDHWF
jgi:hypothetical protein